MGFLDKIKRTVTGPIDVQVQVPGAFAWSDDALVISARLTNSTDESLTVHEVRFKLEIPPPRGKDGPKSTLKVTLDQPFTLGPAETVERRGSIPLSADRSTGVIEGAATNAGLPGWVGTAASGLMGDVPQRSGPHRVKVVVKLDGSSRLSSGGATTTAT